VDRYIYISTFFTVIIFAFVLFLILPFGDIILRVGVVLTLIGAFIIAQHVYIVGLLQKKGK
jgi:hypothetical protein